MKTKLFSLLDDAKLIQSRNRRERISSMSHDDYAKLLDDLEKCSTKKRDIVEKQTDKLDLWLPFPSNTTITQLPRYLFLFDRVCLLDPIYDRLAWLEIFSGEAANDGITISRIYGKHSKHLMSKLETSLLSPTELLKLMREAITIDIDNAIAQYLQYKDYIEEGILVPFIDSTSYEIGEVTPKVDAVVPFLNEALGDDLFLEIEKLLEAIRNQPNRTILDQKIHTLFSDSIELISVFTTGLFFKQAFPSSTSTNIELGDNRVEQVIDRLIYTFGKYLGEDDLQLDNIKWPTIEDELMITTLGGIPPQELMLIRDKEKAAITALKYKTQEHLLDLRNAAGTNEYSKLIKKIRINYKQEIAEIELFADNIKRKYLRNFAHQLFFSSMFASGAMLSAITSTTNPIALLGVGLGASGFAGSVSKIIESWLTYKNEKEKLKERDSYILWRLSKLGK